MTTKKERINFIIFSVAYIVFLIFYATIGFPKENTWLGLVSLFPYLIAVIVWTRSVKKKKVNIK